MATEASFHAELDTPHALTGVVLEQKYRVGNKVAEGGSSAVYSGEHLTLGVPVAIKALKRGTADSSVLKRFGAEARLVAGLEHPNIVRVFDTGIFVPEGSAVSVPWMVLEWLKGKTLQGDLQSRRGSGGRSPAECLPMIKALLSAVAYAHRAGIVHRDIKPSNIHLTRAATGTQVKLLDFGIAKVIEGAGSPITGETVTRGGFRAFSQHYAAPEQLAGARTGPWTDVHALGLLITELLLDAPPYPARDAAEVGQMIFDAVRPTPGRFGISVGPWEQILREMLARRVQDRPTDSVRVLTTLEATVADATAGFSAYRPGPNRVPAVGLQPSDSTRSLIPTWNLAQAPRSAKRERQLVAWAAMAAVAFVFVLVQRTRSPELEPSRLQPRPPAADISAALAASMPTDADDKRSSKASREARSVTAAQASAPIVERPKAGEHAARRGPHAPQSGRAMGSAPRRSIAGPLIVPLESAKGQAGLPYVLE